MGFNFYHGNIAEQMNKLTKETEYNNLYKGELKYKYDTLLVTILNQSQKGIDHLFISSDNVLYDAIASANIRKLLELDGFEVTTVYPMDEEYDGGTTSYDIYWGF